MMTPPRPRLGPRPLPLHLASAATFWMSSYAALPLLRSGWLPWRRECAAAARELQKSLERVAPEAFSAALEAELRAQADVFLRALERYRHHPYERRVAEPPTLWRRGATRLLDYGEAEGVPVLVVPSLVNRAYILDLAENRSFLRFLVRSGLRPLLMDWGRPGDVERGFDLDAYVTDRLEAAAEAAAAKLGTPLAVIGYCMGGLLALALAQRRPQLVSTLALLATPWDFHAERPEQARLIGSLAEPLTQSFAPWGEIPIDVLQALFASLDPLLALRKFTRFAALAEGSSEERDFVAVEDWLNDGVPLALPAARECLGGWYGENAPARGCWRIAGTAISPPQIGVPSLVIWPARDRIVPPAAAAALAQALPAAQRLIPPLGHIGMVVARAAPELVWQPLAQWLLRHRPVRTGSQIPRGKLSMGKQPN